MKDSRRLHLDHSEIARDRDRTTIPIARAVHCVSSMAHMISSLER